MKLLIIGGSGFVSGHVMDAALQAGHEVWYVTRGLRTPVPNAHPIVADRDDTAAFRAALQQLGQRFDAVLDCICFNDEQARADMEILPEFTSRLIAISTDSCYDSAYKKVPQDEHGEKYFEDDSYLKAFIEELRINNIDYDVLYQEETKYPQLIDLWD